MSEIAVVGSMMIDFVTYAERIPVLGETILGSQFEKNFGGKGANQAYMSNNLGVSVAMCCSIGSDAFGLDYVNFLKSRSMTMVCIEDGGSTGIASITVDHAGHNSIVIIPGANLSLTSSTIESLAFESVISSCKLLLCQNEITYEATEAALRMAKQKNIRSVLNPAPANENLKNLIPLVDILCPNETELSTLTGMPTDTMKEVEDAATKLLQLGCSTVIVTLGERGCCVAVSEPANAAQPYSILFVPLPDACTSVKVVDTVGAGDCFIGKCIVTTITLHFFIEVCSIVRCC